MTEFCREFPIKCLTESVLRENDWFTELLRRWHPAGDAVFRRLDAEKQVVRDHVGKKGEFQHLRVAFRCGYMNFYCGGQSIARVRFVRGKLRAEIHEKYVYGAMGREKQYVKLTSEGFLDFGTGLPVACDSEQRWRPYLDQWMSNANGKIEHEKRFVDLLVAHNSNVIDLEMGLPAFSEVPEERRAPRIDIVALEPCEGRWRVVLWEAKRVHDGRARCKGNEPPEVVAQLKSYTRWLSDPGRASRVAKAYQNNCSLLVELHKIARYIQPGIEELGARIRAVAASDTPLPLVDKEPRLLIIYDTNDNSFRENGHLDKLRFSGLRVKTVESLSELAL